MKRIYIFCLALATITLIACKDKNTNNIDGANTEKVENTESAVVTEDTTVEEEQAEIAVKEGEEAPDFSLNDLNGKPLALSSLKGKYVIIDFWGSWCPWCVKGMPDMKKYYDKYNDKMDILSVDYGDTPEMWKEAVEENNMTWKNVLDDEKKSAVALYGIEGFPTKIVVDPKGKIAKIVVGEDPALYTYLDDLFK